MSTRFDDVGAPAHLAATWFAGLLRDGFALTAANGTGTFADLANESLRVGLHDQPLNRELEDAVSYVMKGFAGLPVHADVPDGIRALRDLGIRLVTLSNGSASVAEALFDRAGIGEHFERLLTVEDAGRWKPAPEAYQYALTQCGVDPADACAPGQNRTADTRFRRAVLYPLSYEGGTGEAPCRGYPTHTGRGAHHN